MMNTARLAVGLQGLGLSDRAYQNALRYSRERLQMRSLSGAKFPDKPADPIIVHPDVRRMLLTCKALVEGGRVLGYHAAQLVDIVAPARRRGRARAGRRPARFPHADRQGLPDRMGRGVHLPRAAVLRRPRLHRRARHGAAGPRCAHHHAVRRHHRHPGAGPVGSQDHAAAGRRAEACSSARSQRFCDEHAGNAALADFIAPLREKAAQWQQLTMQVGKRAVGQCRRKSVRPPTTTCSIRAMSRWPTGGLAASRPPRHRRSREAFKDDKRDTARFYFARILPRTLTHAAAIESGVGRRCRMLGVDAA